MALRYAKSNGQLPQWQGLPSGFYNEIILDLCVHSLIIFVGEGVSQYHMNEIFLVVLMLCGV